MKEGVVYDESVWSGRVERGKVSVSRDVAIEVCMRKGSSMKGSPIDGSVLCPSSL